MKKTLVLLIALLLVISLTSCGQKETVSSDSSSDNYSQISSSEQENTSSTISKEEEMINRIAESMKLETVNTSVYRNFGEIGRIIDIDIDAYDGFFGICYVINETGELYKLSFDKPFVSGYYFEQIPLKNKLKKFLPEAFFYLNIDLAMIDENGTIIAKEDSTDEWRVLTEQSYITAYSGVYGNFELKMLESARITAVPRIMTADNIKIFNYNDKRIFEHPITCGFSGKTVVNLPEDEKIEFVLEGVVKTNKGWHTLKEVQTNKEECEQYAGVEPVYEWQLVKMDFGDDIILAKEVLKDAYCAVTNDNTVYIVG